MTLFEQCNCAKKKAQKGDPSGFFNTYCLAKKTDEFKVRPLEDIEKSFEELRILNSLTVPKNWRRGTFRDCLKFHFVANIKNVKVGYFSTNKKFSEKVS